MASLLFISVIVIVVFWGFRKILRKFWGQADRFNEEDVTNKVVIVTGANAGIGKCTALELADRGAIVVMACRDLEKAEKAIIDIRKTTSRGRLLSMKLNLGSLASIREFATEVTKKFDKIDILINNAGVWAPVGGNMKTEDGFEANFGINHLGHFLLTNLLLEPIKRAAPSRIVTVGSQIHKYGHIDFSDLMYEKKELSTEGKNMFINPLYANSKLANSLFSQELSKRLWGTNVSTYCLCPGIVKTEIGKNIKIPWYMRMLLSLLAMIMIKTPREGCQTTLHCALSKECKYQTGEMYEHCRRWLPENRIPLRVEVAARLWTVSEKLVGLQ